jgi:Co/Zn/Cd efflux system component
MVYVLMDFNLATPDHVDVEALTESLSGIPHVSHVTNLRVWSLSLSHTVVSAHVHLEEGCDVFVGEAVAEGGKICREVYGASEVTLQVVPFGF